MTSPRNEYHVQKLAQEYYTIMHNRDYAIEGVIARVSNACGVGISTERKSVIAKFILRALAGKSLQVHGSGRQKRNFIHISDVTAALKKIIFNQCDLAGEIINIAGAEDIEIAELADMISKRFSTPKENIPYRDNIEPMTQHSISIEKAKKLLAFVPQKKLTDGINELIDFFSNEEAAKSAALRGARK